MNNRHTGPFKRCRKTQRIVGFNFEPWYMKSLLPVLGIASIIWILVRVIPKPSRVRYPCIQVAAPLAASFFGYLGVTALLATIVRFFQKAKKYQKRIMIGACAACSVVGIYAQWSVADGLAGGYPTTTMTDPVTFMREANDPIGDPRGTVPGRVVWTHYPSAINHDLGGDSHRNWFTDEFNHQGPINNMVTDSILSLTKTETEGEAWEELFRNFNARRGNGLVGYQPGQKIAIKINQNCAHRLNRRDLIGVNGNPAGGTTGLQASPQMTLALINSLVLGAGIPAENITIYDSSRFISLQLAQKCRTAHPNIQFREYPDDDPTSLDDAEYTTETQIRYSKASTRSLQTNQRIPLCALNADYLINMADLKGHGQYATLCSKNWFGSTDLNISPSLNQHFDINVGYPRHAEREYMMLVDYMAHKDLGEKTVLFMINALTGHYEHWEGPCFKLKNPPFNNRWASSLFVSQDMVAIDSVGQDFVRCEFDWLEARDHFEEEHSGFHLNPNWDYCDKYLVEAALAPGVHWNPREFHNSTTGWIDGEWYQYDPEGDGQVVTNSLGVYERWNNVTDREYTGNMGGNSGIQLYKVYEDKITTSTNGIIEFEAEAFNKNTARNGFSWTSITTNINDEVAILMQSTQNLTQNNKTNYLSESPRLDYGVLFPTSGVYYVWIRGNAQNGRVNDSDSCHVGLDYIAGTDQSNTQNLSAEITGFNADLQWASNTADNVRAQMYVPTAGYHLVNLWMQKAGFSVDKIVLTADADYVPTDAVLADSISFNPTPTQLPTEGETSITIDYSSAISRDAVIRIFDSNSVAQTEGRVTVLAGSGQIAIPLILLTPLTNGDTYGVQADLLEIDGDETTSVASSYTTAVAIAPVHYKLNITSTLPALSYEISTHGNAVFDTASASLDIQNAIIMRWDDMEQGNLSAGQSFKSNYRLSIESIVLRSGSSNTVHLNNLGADGIRLNLVGFSDDVPTYPLYAEDFLFSEANTTAVQGYDYLTFNLTTPVEIARGQQVLFTAWYMNDQGEFNNDLGFMRTDLGYGSVYPDGASYYAFYRNTNDVTAASLYPLVFPMSSAPHAGRDMAFGITGTRIAKGFEAAMEAAAHPIDKSAPDDDLDDDGDSNFFEYAFGGDLDDPLVKAPQPFVNILNNEGVDELVLIYHMRTDTNGLNYVIETTEALTNTVWDTINANRIGSKELGSEFSETTNSIPMDLDQKFIRVRVSE